ncbi:MAG TPA: CaiB/BaiF CoA-transferase family protein [Vicinamibacteria bacterium]|nr:CaiB/BaiF CoA-transferase family protein [Vicinamibacteria bacterium]
MNALDGVRVLDLTRYIPGPYCTMLLGDLGADVVKVEEPFLGDPTRVVPPAAGEDSALHAALNRNKRSVAVDLRSDEGAAIVRRLAAASDVLVEAYRPGVLERRGLGPAALLATNPRLVYCSVTGFGQEGTLRSRAGHDITYLARSGFLGASVGADGRPVLPPTQVADMAGALVATLGILAALQARERTGRGQHVDASMSDGMRALLTVPAARRLAGGPHANELSGAYACYNVYRCRDGRYLAVGALEPKFWEALCEALGHPALARAQWDEARQGELVRTLAATFATRDRDAWVESLAARDACVEPVLDLDEALAQPQAAGGPLRLAETPCATRREAPRLGQHTDEVLEAAGYSREEIGRLRDAGAVA